MIDKIIYFSLHHRLAVMIGTILVVLGGFFAVQKMDVDVFPDLTAPTVVVMTDCHGMASEEVSASSLSLSRPLSMAPQTSDVCVPVLISAIPSYGQSSIGAWTYSVHDR